MNKLTSDVDVKKGKPSNVTGTEVTNVQQRVGNDGTRRGARGWPMERSSQSRLVRQANRNMGEAGGLPTND